MTDTNTNAARNGSDLLHDIKFSVEIECSLPMDEMRSRGWVVGRYHNGAAVPGFSGWTVEADASLQTSRRGHRMVEVVGPVMQGIEGLVAISSMLSHLSEMGGRVNKSCGLHINVSHPELFSVRAIRRLIRLTARHEKALFAINGSPTREDDYDVNYYCKSIRTSYKNKGYGELRALRNIVQSYSERYHTLNLQHVNERPSSRRVEFRVMGGTLSSKKVMAYIAVFLGLVEVAIAGKGKPSWDMPKAQRDSDLPDGVHAVRKLFSTLRWKPAAGLRSQIHSGNIKGIVTEPTLAWAAKAYGVMTPTVRMGAEFAEHAAAELMRLARKYDTLRGATFRGNDIGQAL